MPLPLNRLYLSHSLSEPAFGATDGELFYVKLADGARHIYRQQLESGLSQPVTSEPAPSGAVGYGGGVFAVRGTTLVYAAKGGRLIGLDTQTAEQWTVTPPFEGVAAPAISPCGRFVAFVAELDGHANVLLVDVRGHHLPVKLSADPWYALNPSFAPDGTRVVWMEWDAPVMPWDEARLVTARLARPTGESELPAHLLPLTTSTVARPGTAYASPQFSPDGRWLAYTSDETGWRSLWVADAGADDLRASAVRVDTGPGEIGGPDWVANQIKMRWSEDSRSLWALRRHQSRTHLLRVDWPAQTVSEIETGWTWLADLNVGAGQAVFIGARPTQPETIVTLDLASGAQQPRATSAVGLTPAAELIEPRVINWATANGLETWGIFYEAAGDGPRPLIVHVHGGPTSERPLTWEPQAQYFATRGWHYLELNHRGGTGFGRAYQDMLTGQWGVVDIEDARSGAEHLVQTGLADRQRLVITGSSAGGYSTLMALTQQPDFWTAGVSFAGIAAFYDLKQGSHRFEVNYEDKLLGRLPEAAATWVQRSPLTHAAKVRAPVLLFHGGQDKAVPTKQSVDYAEAVRRGGGVAELVIYEEEGHSFTREHNRRDMYIRMEQFLEKYVVNLQNANF
jgi:dipeptidyl aminopeptidase/acylaminoacyl peptidase